MSAKKLTSMSNGADSRALCALITLRLSLKTWYLLMVSSFEVCTLPYLARNYTYSCCISLSSILDSKSDRWVGGVSGRVTKPMTAKVAVVAKRRYTVFLLFGVPNSLFNIF